MINQYKNNEEILKATKPKSAVRLNRIDLDFFKSPQLNIEWRDDIITSTNSKLNKPTETTTDQVAVLNTNKVISNTSVIEMHVYSESTWITGNHHINASLSNKTSYVDPITNIRYNLQKQPIQIDLYQEFEKLNLTRGNYRVVFNFFGNVIGNYEKQTLRIVEISPDRTEIRLRSTNQDDPQFLQEITNYIQNIRQLETSEEISRVTTKTSSIRIMSPAKYRPLLLNFSNNKTALFVNSVVIGDELFIKLYEPLNTNIQLGDACWIVEEKKSSYVDSVSISISQNRNRIVSKRLSSPNWDANSSYETSTDVGLRNWNDILGSSISTSQQIVDKIFSGSLSGIELNIDYSDFNNFVFYSSATERIKNFKYKLDLIEYYDSQLSILSNISGSTAVTNVSDFTNKKSILIGGFDSFEKYLYYESSSGYFTQNIPLADANVSFITGSYITPYPKANTTVPYTIYSTTSSIAIDWYQNLLISAETYDRFNNNSLINAIPMFVRTDVSSESLETFIHMLGHHYDILYTYVRNMNRIHSRDEHPKFGVPNELLFSVAKQFGWTLTNGNQSSELWSYLLGTNEAGIPQTGSNSVGDPAVSIQDVTYNTWRRIVNNLPGLLKSKGTKRSIKALLSCYGIPQSMISINEYGGPRIDRAPVYEKLNFDYALDLITNTAGTVTVDYDQPINSVELRFRTDDVLKNPSMPSTMNLFSIDSNDVTIDFTRGTLGTIQINQTSSADIEMFDGGWLNVLLRSGSNGSLEVVAKKSKYGKIVAAVSASATSSFGSTGTLTLGGTSGGSRLRGQLQELRLWSSSLQDAPFNNHTKAPAAYDANTDAYSELVFRLPLTQKIDHSTTSSLMGVEPNSSGISASFASWTNNIPYNSIEETYYYDAISLAAGTFDDNKIRLEDNELIGTLDVKTRAERSQFDKAPLDSKKLGVFFSPQTMINEDIVAQLGFTELDSYIGDPSQVYEKSYPDLIRTAHDYWKKYDTKNDINAYLKMFSLFDMSFFRQLEQLLPARVDKITGVVIQPNVLERNKDSVLPRVSRENASYNSIIDANETTAVTAAYTEYNGFIQDNIVSITAQDDDQWQGYLTKSSDEKYAGTTYSHDYLYWNGTEYITGSTPYWEAQGVMNYISGSTTSLIYQTTPVEYNFTQSVNTTGYQLFQSSYSRNPRNVDNPYYITPSSSNVIIDQIITSSTDISATYPIDNIDYVRQIILPNSSVVSTSETINYYELINNDTGNPTGSGGNVFWGDLYEYCTSYSGYTEYTDTTSFFSMPISINTNNVTGTVNLNIQISLGSGSSGTPDADFVPAIVSNPSNLIVSSSSNYITNLTFDTSINELKAAFGRTGNWVNAEAVYAKLFLRFTVGAKFNSEEFNLQRTNVSGTSLPNSYILANISSSFASSSIVAYSGSIYEQAQIQDFLGTGLENSFYNGSKMSSRAFNVSSPDTIDGGPVVETRETNPNQLIYQAPAEEGSFSLSGRPGRKRK